MVCKAKTFDCPIALCGATRLKNLEDHWANECRKVNLTCSACHIVLQRDGIPNHNCVKILQEEKAVDKAIIAKLKAENKMFQDQAK